MGLRNLTVLALATLVVTLTAATNVAGGNGGVTPAEETQEKPAESEEMPAETEVPAEETEEKPAPADTPADTVTEKYDIKALVARLRDTKAIGFFTKLALKNQIDDLMDRFRRFHAREEETPLETLRDQFNLLFMKVVTLLQDRDPALGQEIATGREILWTKLADPREFARL
jgi:hypothetical protein